MTRLSTTEPGATKSLPVDNAANSVLTSMSRFSIFSGISNMTWSQITWTLNMPVTVSTFWSMPAGQEATIADVMAKTGRAIMAASSTEASKQKLFFIVLISPPDHPDAKYGRSGPAGRKSADRRALPDRFDHYGRW